jgi:S1-C subfamily serine protease
MNNNLRSIICFALLVSFSVPTTAKGRSALPVNWEKCVVLLEKEVQDENGAIDTLPHGTGFLFYDRWLGLLLVTNRHLLQGRDRVLVRYNRADFDPAVHPVRYHREPCELIGQNSTPLWKGHPNPTVDVAAVRLPYPSVKVDDAEIEYPRFMDFDSLTVGEDVFFFGFPLGFLGLKGKGDFPILRSGVVSYKAFELTAIPTTFFETKCTGFAPIDSAMFLIDGFSFPGNSGSPVLTRVTASDKGRLVGIVTGHIPLNHQYAVVRPLTVEESAHKANTLADVTDTVTIEQNTGLAVAVCADRIRETLELFRKR